MQKKAAEEEVPDQKQLQDRIERIIYGLLRRRGEASQLRNDIEDLLLAEYGWKEYSFGFVVTIDGFQNLIEEVNLLGERAKMQLGKQQSNSNDFITVDEIEV